jgi:hypothetical protein
MLVADLEHMLMHGKYTGMDALTSLLQVTLHCRCAYLNLQSAILSIHSG